MTRASDPSNVRSAPHDEVGALMLALGCLMVQAMCGGLAARALRPQVAAFEILYVLELLGGGQRRNQEFQALSRPDQLYHRRRLMAEYFGLRRCRLELDRRATEAGEGYRRRRPEIALRRFERRIAARRTCSLGAARLSHVSPTNQPLAGAPP